ncbi:hypothetical protein [Ottowia sp. VDI28]|uniref:hypothetical protein n=1 Tax=Ottowia sp. VDI28 TaxID=3133968 RepID=UPI003C2B740F
MKERPVLFSAPMVRALLAGTKTQTRRIVKTEAAVGREAVFAARTGKRHAEVFLLPEMADLAEAHCPYGQPGDRLWVREAIRLVPDQEPDDGTGRVLSIYAADGSLTVADAWPWKRSYLPPMHCPRGLSRIDLEVTGVRVERLQDISEADCWAEGIEEVIHDFSDSSQYDMAQRLGCCFEDAKPLYAQLWESIHGARSWDANPWVWALSFRRLP